MVATPMHTPASDDTLSPIKIANLILVYLYLYEELPNRRQIVCFLAKQLEGSPIVHNNSLVLLGSLKDYCDAIELHSRQSGVANVHLDALDRFLFKFLTIAWSITTTDLIQQLSMDAYRRSAEPLSTVYLGPLQISSRSPIGRFVRTMAALLKLLQFEESSELVAGFCRFRASTQPLYETLSKHGLALPRPVLMHLTPASEPLFLTWTALQRRDTRGSYQNPEESAKDAAFEEALNRSLRNESLALFGAVVEDKSSAAISAPVSIPDMDLLVNAQVRLLEQFGTPTPEFLRNIMAQMASHRSSVYSSMPSLHYLQYMENLARGEYHEAFNSLHKYFDYMVSKGSKYFYHFALVSKASLHQHFGEDEEALDTMEEAIAIARENRDSATLTFVLSWLYDFMRRRPVLWNSRIFRQMKNDLRLLDYLVKKSVSVSLSLAAVSYRFEAEHLLNGRCSFSKYYESLFKAGFFAANDSIPSFIGVCHTTARVWRYAGYPRLCELYTTLGLHYSKLHGQVRDVLMFNMEDARCKYYLGKRDLLLPDMKRNAELCNSNVVQFKATRILLLLRQIEVALGKGRVRMAHELLQYVPRDSELDQDCLFEKTRVEALVKLAQENNSDALMCVSNYIANTNKLQSLRPDILYLIEHNFLKARILIQSGVPLRAFSLVLQQMELAKQMGLRALVARGCLHLTQIFNMVHEPDDAFSLATSVLPLVASVGDIELLSNMFFELATSHHQFLDRDETRLSMSKTSLFVHFLNLLSLSIAGFKKSVNLEMLVKSFELEDRMARTALKHAEIRDSEPFEVFRKHSQTGLDILRRRAHEEGEYGYLREAAAAGG